MKIKKIDEYSRDQILKLEKESIERIIKLSLADAGIKLPKAPTEPTYHEIVEPDKTLYMLSPFDTIAFEKKEIAEEIAKVLRGNFSTLRKIIYNWEIGSEFKTDTSLLSDYQYHEGPAAIVVKEVKTYSVELYAQIKDKLNENTLLRKAYETEKTEYDKINESAKDTIDYIYETIEKVQQDEANKKRLLGIFKEYLELAENKVPVAWAFMHKAYSVSDEEKDYINANL